MLYSFFESYHRDYIQMRYSSFAPIHGFSRRAIAVVCQWFRLQLVPRGHECSSQLPPGERYELFASTTSSAGSLPMALVSSFRRDPCSSWESPIHRMLFSPVSRSRVVVTIASRRARTLGSAGWKLTPPPIVGEMYPSSSFSRFTRAEMT